MTLISRKTIFSVFAFVSIGLWIGSAHVVAQDSDTAGHMAGMSHNESHNESHMAMDMVDPNRPTVAVFLYDGALVLDYGIAAEMFLAADFMQAFNVITVSETGSADVSILRGMTTAFTFESAPSADIVIVPGGPNWPTAGSDPDVQAYLQRTLNEGGTLYSVCTGALVLAQAGLLDGRNATTVHFAAHMFEQVAPGATFLEQNFVDDGNIVTSAGSGTAIESTLHLIERFTSAEIAEDLRSRYMDYPYARRPRRVEPVPSRLAAGAGTPLRRGDESSPQCPRSESDH